VAVSGAARGGARGSRSGAAELPSGYGGNAESPGFSGRFRCLQILIGSGS